MKMSKFKNLGGLVIFLPALVSSAFAGQEIGNGGGAWVCRDTKQNVVWAELVDLFEAKNEYGLTLQPSSDQTADEQFAEARQRLQVAAPLLVPSFDSAYQKVEANWQWLGDNVDLQIVDDSLYQIMPSAQTCANGLVKYEQVINFTQDGLVLVKKSLFQALPAQSQAALRAHEALYAYLRISEQAPNSIRARKEVGYLFSTLAPDSLVYGQQFEGKDQCGMFGDISTRIKDCNHAYKGWTDVANDDSVSPQGLSVTASADGRFLIIQNAMGLPDVTNSATLADAIEAGQKICAQLGQTIEQQIGLAGITGRLASRSEFVLYRDQFISGVPSTYLSSDGLVPGSGQGTAKFNANTTYEYLCVANYPVR